MIKRNKLSLLLPILIIFSGCILLTGCGKKESSSTATKETTTAKKDFLIGTWFAKSSTYNGESRDPDEIFGGTFYLTFNDKGECTMAIDQQRALLTWERTKEGVTLKGDDTYKITFPDDSEKTLLITIKGVDTLMEKYEE